MGCGMIVVLPAPQAARAVSLLSEGGDEAWVLGRLEAGPTEVRFTGSSKVAT
jgi:phosphoribosylaminoimidazole (AIR) synthetase